MFTGKIVTVFCEKGGVGKSTVTSLLADGVCASYKKTLVVDLDDTPALSRTLLGDASVEKRIASPTEDSRNIVDYLVNFARHGTDVTPPFCPVDRLVIGNNIVGLLNVMPGSRDLYALEQQLVASYLSDPGVTLEQATASIRDSASAGLKHCASSFDLTLIDCPPRASQFAIAAIQASDLVVVPFRPDFIAETAIRETVKLIKNAGDESSEPRTIPYALVPNLVVNRWFSEHVTTMKTFLDSHPNLGISIPESKSYAAALAFDAGQQTLSQKYGSGNKGKKLVEQLSESVWDLLVAPPAKPGVLEALAN